MKKLMIAAAVVLAAVTVNAAAANWKASVANLYDGTGVNASKLAPGTTVLFFDAGVTTQSALFDLWKKGEDIGSKTAGYVTSLDLNSSSTFPSDQFAYGEQSASASELKNYAFYFTVIEDEKIYFSNQKELSANATATAKPIAFGTQIASGNDSKGLPTGKGYEGAGKWSSVPEPTSALLMLLGVAGLALKRKQK